MLDQSMERDGSLSEKQRANQHITILVVDDDKGIRDLLQIALGDEGYCVLVSAEGTALRLAPEQSPDLILLDLSRALAHGHALIRTLRAEAATAHSPLVGFSARHDGALLAEQMKLDDFLSKPFDLGDLDALW